MSPDPAHGQHPPSPQEADAAGRQLGQILASHPSHGMKEGGLHLRADQHLDLPSAMEVLTILQFGYPRSYNLNDGMGPDMDFA